ncbi:TIGR03086 family metal-binding protein [Spirillospora sp. CA-253888]
MTMNPAEAAALQRYGAELLERSIAYALVALQPVTPGALARPTPCTGWDLGMLLAHFSDSLAALHEAVDAGTVGPPAGAAPPPWDDPAAGCRAAAGRLVGAWTAAGRQDRLVTVGGCALRAGVVAGTGAIEIAVHGWDVARALGERRAIPPSLAARLLRLAPALVTEENRDRLFAPETAPPEDAPAGDRLLAFLGRDPGLVLPGEGWPGGP